MKKILALTAASVLLFSCGGDATTTPSYTIKGELKGLDSVAYLKMYDYKEVISLDTSIVSAEGKFEFTGSVELPVLSFITDKDGKTLNYVLLENSNITVIGDVLVPDSIKVTGSKEGALLDSLKIKIINTANQQERLTFVDEFIEANPKSIVSAYCVFSYLSPGLELDELKSYAAKLDSSIHKSIYVGLINERIATLEKSAIGQPFIDFTSKDIDDNEVAFSSIAGQGKWVMLDFWASWCGPCRVENPHVVAAYNKFKHKDFTIVGFSLDKSKEEWLAAIEKDGLQWVNLSDLNVWQSGPSSAYGVNSIPSNFIINPEGIIVAKNLKGEELKNFLEQNIK